MGNHTFPVGLTFDDILLPAYADFPRSDIDLSTKLTKHISLEIPFVSVLMDTVTEAKLAIALLRAHLDTPAKNTYFGEMRTVSDGEFPCR